MSLFGTDLYSFNCPDNFLQSVAPSGCLQDLGYIEKLGLGVEVAKGDVLCPAEYFIGWTSYQHPYLYS